MLIELSFGAVVLPCRVTLVVRFFYVVVVY